MYLGTDDSGNVVAKEGASGGGSTSGTDGGYYTPSVTQPDEYADYYSYCEECKAFVKEQKNKYLY